MEVLRFQANIPEEVALKFDDGKAVEGRYGDQVLYTLTDDRVMYLPPIAAKRITDLRIRKNELMSVCKQEVARGQKRSIEWVWRTGRNIFRVSFPAASSNAWRLRGRWLESRRSCSPTSRRVISIRATAKR